METLDLVQSAKTGRREALDALFARYEARVRKVVRMRLGDGLRRFVDSGDIVQDTFLNAIGAFGRFEIRSEASVINWLAKISENAIRDAAGHYGAAKRRQPGAVPIDGGDSGEEAGWVEDAAPGPQDAALAHDEESRVVRALERLSAEHREIIVLRDYVGYSWAEVAREHGRPSEDAARAMHTKALIALERVLRRDER